MAGEQLLGDLIRQWRGGVRARNTLVERLHPEFRLGASAQLRRKRHVSFSSGNLITDAMLRIVQMGRTDIADRAHITALAALMMRHILIDHACVRRTDKRRYERVVLNDDIDCEHSVDLIRLEAALSRLAVIDGGLVELVEMRFFGDMPLDDVAATTSLSNAPVKRCWPTARAWLAAALEEPLDVL